MRCFALGVASHQAPKNLHDTRYLGAYFAVAVVLVALDMLVVARHRHRTGT
jgi:hypothetical protein